MEEEKKELKEEQAAETKEQTVETEEQPAREDQVEKLKETTEKIWGSTKQAWGTAAFKASQYKKLVQKKIDISALHKKINGAHAELGKLIDDLHSAEQKNIMNLAEVKDLLTKLDDLKAEAVLLEEEVEQLKNEQPPQDEACEEKAE